MSNLPPILHANLSFCEQIRCKHHTACAPAGVGVARVLGVPCCVCNSPVRPRVHDSPALPPPPPPPGGARLARLTTRTFARGKSVCGTLRMFICAHVCVIWQYFEQRAHSSSALEARHPQVPRRRESEIAQTIVRRERR